MLTYNWLSCQQRTQLLLLWWWMMLGRSGEGEEGGRGRSSTTKGLKSTHKGFLLLLWSVCLAGSEAIATTEYSASHLFLHLAQWPTKSKQSDWSILTETDWLILLEGFNALTAEELTTHKSVGRISKVSYSTVICVAASFERMTVCGLETKEVAWASALLKSVSVNWTRKKTVEECPLRPSKQQGQGLRTCSEIFNKWLSILVKVLYTCAHTHTTTGPHPHHNTCSVDH